MKRTTYVYGLWCPVHEAFFYVGASIDPVLRLRQHVADVRIIKAHRQFPHLYVPLSAPIGKIKTDWIIWLAKQDHSPELVILETIGPQRRQYWREAERQWIEFLLEKGHPLTNEPLMFAAGTDDRTLLEAAIERGRQMFGASPAQ